MSKYYKNNKEVIRKYQRTWERNRLNTNIEFKIKKILRSRINSIIHHKLKAGSAIKDLGCTTKELILYLEKRFYLHIKTGIKMTWENYGLQWHTDHIKSLALFDLTNRK